MSETRRSGAEVELARLLEHVEPSSRSSAKFHGVQAWFAKRFGLDPSEIVCKSLVDDKNVHNRIEEALRQSPRFVVLVDYGTTRPIIERLLARLEHIDFPPVAIRCSKNSRGWHVADIICQADGDMDDWRDRLFPGAAVTTFVKSGDRSTIISKPTLTDEVCTALLEQALASMEIEIGPRSNKHEVLRDTFAAVLGIDSSLVVCKALADVKNFGNRIGEGLGLAPALLVLLLPSGGAADVRRLLERQLQARDLDTAIVFVEKHRGHRWRVSECIGHADTPLLMRLARLLPEMSISRSFIEDIEEPERDETGSATCTYCQRSLVDSIRAAHGTMKSCPRCSAANGEHHVFHAYPDEFGSTQRRVSAVNRDGAQSYCIGCRRGEKPRDGVPCSAVQRSGRAASPTSGRDWRRWSLNDWKDRFFDHYFVVRAGNRAPLEHLDVSPLVFKRMIGDEQANGEEAVDAFIDAVRREVGGHTFKRSAQDVQDWVPWNTGTKDNPSEPHFLPHLIFSCLVAAGYGPQAEGSYQTRLQAALGDVQRGQDLSFLPRLWDKLQYWLQRRASDFGDYRRLILPPADSWRVNIGYSIDLAFPNWRDRRKLSELLFDPALEGTDPPLRETLHCVQDKLAQFTPEFGDRFKRLMERVYHGTATIDSDPVWRVIAQAASRCWGEETSEKEEEYILVVEPLDEALTLAVATTSSTQPPAGMMLHDPELTLDQFDRYLAYTDEDPYQGVDRVIVDVFSGAFRISSAAGFINQGVLPFVEGNGRLMTLARGSEVASARYALVRADRCGAFVAAFGGQSYPSDQITGWFEVHECEIRIQDELPAGLERAWCLVLSVSPTRVTLRGGIRVGSGYLLVNGRLPEAGIPGAETAYCMRPNGPEVEMDAVGDGAFALPAGLEPGIITIQGRREDGSIVASRRLELWAQTPSTRYKAPTPKRTYWLEAPGTDYDEYEGGAELPLLVTETSREPPELTRWTVPSWFLGPRIGDISEEPRDGFDWVVTKEGGQPILVFRGDRERPTLPMDGLGPRNAVREYRRLFSKGRTASALDHELFGRYKANVRRSLTIRAAERFENSWMPMPAQPSVIGRAADDRVETFEFALAALSYNRAGIPAAELFDLFGQVLGIADHALRWELIRAWTEAGAFDIARDAAWSSVRIFARRPRFVAYRQGDMIHASVIGLTTALVRSQIESHASASRMEVSQRTGPNPYLPAIPTVRCADWSVLADLAETLEFALPEVLHWPDGDSLPAWLDLSHARLDHGLHQGTPLPLNYRERGGPKNFPPPDAQRAGERPPVTLHRLSRRDRPPLHVVKQAGEILGWARSPNWARLRACLAAGVVPFRLRGMVMRRLPKLPVYLPLGVGRLCAITGPLLPGPGDDGTYTYTLPTRALAAALARSCPWIAFDSDAGARRALLGTDSSDE